MAGKKHKETYEDALADAKRLVADTEVSPEDEYSLEDILAEYGESREQKLLADIDAQVEQTLPPAKAQPETAAATGRTSGFGWLRRKIAQVLQVPMEELGSPTVPSDAPSAKDTAENSDTPTDEDAAGEASAPVEEGVPAKDVEPSPQPHPPAEGGAATSPTQKAPDSPPDDEEISSSHSAPISQGAQEDFSGEEADDDEEAALEQALPQPPRPISMEEVVSRTVDSVLEAEQAAQPKPKKHLLARFPRKRPVEAEVLYSQPEEKPEEEPEEKPEIESEIEPEIESEIEPEIEPEEGKEETTPQPEPQEEQTDRSKPQKRRRGLFSRKKLVDTEELYPPAEEEPEEEEEEVVEEPPKPAEPEVPLMDAAETSRNIIVRLAHPLPLAAIITALLAVVLTVAEQGVVIPLWSDSALVQSGVLLGVLLIVGSLCRSVFVRAADALRHRKCTGEVLISLAAMVTAADCLTRVALPQRSDSASYTVVVCSAMVLALWGGAREAQGLFDTFRAASITDQPPYLVTETVEGACKQAGRVEGFYTGVAAEVLPARWQSIFLPIVAVASVVFAGLSSLGQGRGQDFFLCWSAILAGGTSFALSLSWSLPFSSLARQLQRNGCAVAGWSGAEAVSRKKSVILTDADLFPPGTVHLNGIKLFGDEMSRAVSYAASLVQASGSGLSRLFDGLLRSESGHLQELDDFSFYEEGGYSAAIHGESVLLGTASFMRKMEVRLPGNLNLHTGLYLSVDRQLTAVFAVKYQTAENVAWALRLLRRNHVKPILASRDPNITPVLLKRKFGGGRLEYPPLAARLALSEAERGQGMPRALLLREGLMPYAETVVGSRRLCRGARQCTVLALFGSGTGTLLAFYLSFLGSFTLLTPMMVLLFQALWIVPVLLTAGWTGRF